MVRKSGQQRREFTLNETTEENRRRRDMPPCVHAVERYYAAIPYSERKEERRWGEFADSEFNKVSDGEAMPHRVIGQTKPPKD
jgi:hypothetical protein